MPGRKSQQENPIERVRALHTRGDVRSARRLAWEIQNDAAAPREARAEAEDYRRRTEVDRRALAIGFGALALGIFVVVAFILLRR